mmetsp:Transcript_38810/g.68145  ORF Transcript_38810/g.68145 Transcript_38810/m.68145 type:complete len:433 (-) Transcript_38810:146-1444(-)
MQQNQIILAVVAILTWSSSLLGHAYFPKGSENAPIQYVTYSSAEAAAIDAVSSAASPHQNHRSLRLSHYFDPKSVVPRANNTITVYLALSQREIDQENRDRSMVNRFDILYGHSIFKTDILRRYGSGRVQFLIREHAQCLDCSDVLVGQTALQNRAPCLAVRGMDTLDCASMHMKCNYPQCITMTTNDEGCQKALSYDARLYFTSEARSKGSLPLGLRLDSWISLQKIQARPNFFIFPASKRKYGFNAIFSKVTNPAREQLVATIIEQQSDNNSSSRLPIFTKFAGEFNWNTNGENSDQLHTDQTMEVMLDSIFTLSPAGHNPETFRMNEAIEAGSIPVMVRNDLYINSKYQHKCLDALERWYDAPILVLDSWKDLYPTVERLMEDPAALDEMQVTVRMWYDNYMRKAVTDFEDFMIKSSSLEVAGSLEYYQ